MKTIRTLSALPALLSVSLLLPGAAAYAGAENAKQGPLAVKIVAVIPPDAPPTYYLDKQTGKAAGFAVDIMQAVSARAGLDVSYVFEDGWADIIEMVMNGQADLVPGMGVSEVRGKDLAFSAPIDAFPISFFVRAEHPGIEASSGVHAVGVIRGSVAFEKLKDRANIRLVPYEGFPQGLFDLLAGKIEAFACPAPTLWQLARESSVEDHIKVVDRPIAEITRAIAVRRDDRALLERLNAAIGGYVGTPEYQQVYVKWYGKPAPYWTERRIVAVSVSVVLVVIVLMGGWRYVSLLRLNRKLKETIAQRERAEVAIRENESVLRSFLNAFTESALLIDRQGRILAANETVAKRLGVTTAALIGSNAYDHVPPDVAQVRRAHMDAVFRTGAPSRFEDERMGKIIDNSLYPVFDPEGAVSAIAIIGVDVTERKKAATALGLSEKKYRMLYDSAIDGIFIVSMDGTFIDVNRTAHERLGYTRDELLALHLSRLDPPDFAAKVGERIGQLLEQGQLIFESAHRKKDGSIMPVEINTRVIDYDGRKAIFSIVRDITERKQAQQEREKLIAELQKALAEIKTLHGILPICASCKKIRDEKGAWHHMEAYIHDHTDADFSHGLCTDCADKLYPGFMNRKT